MSLLMNALMAEADTASDIAEAVDNMTSRDAATAGFAAGIAVTTVFLILLVWFILQVIADWKIFTKAGEAGWKSLIPFYNYYVEYRICWTGSFGLIYGVASFISTSISGNENPSWQIAVGAICGIIAFVLHIKESFQLSKSFAKGTGFAIFLILLGPIARLVLGFGPARYVGNRS